MQEKKRMMVSLFQFKNVQNFQSVKNQHQMDPLKQKKNINIFFATRVVQHIRIPTSAWNFVSHKFHDTR